MLLCSFLGRLSVAACKSSIVFFMFSGGGGRRLLSASYLFSVGVDGLLGVVLCCLLWMVCAFFPFVVWFVVVGWKIPAFDRLADWIHF